MNTDGEKNKWCRKRQRGRTEGKKTRKKEKRRERNVFFVFFMG